MDIGSIHQEEIHLKIRISIISIFLISIRKIDDINYRHLELGD